MLRRRTYPANIRLIIIYYCYIVIPIFLYYVIQLELEL